MINFIDDEKKKYGVESICRILPIAPSTYYRIKDEQNNPEKQSRRKQNDSYLLARIKQVWQASGCRYGIRKVWHKLKQDGMPKLGRCTVERLMKQLGIQGVWRALNLFLVLIIQSLSTITITMIFLIVNSYGKNTFVTS
ncbi:IS3 family transposase [Moraxella osloensis]|jgi:hypothetical protein|nr:IS3 family transposase [Moraxella osloensis]